MKTNVKINIAKCLLMTAMVSFMFYACQNDEIVDNHDLETANPESQPKLRATSFDTPSSSNPNLHDNWENVDEILLNKNGTIASPWKDKGVSSSDIPRSYAEDIKKEDGWKMLFHTMLNAPSAEPDYMVFYNRNRGLLKVFYFNHDAVKNNSLVWSLEANSPTTVLPSNTLIQGNFNTSNKYATTSNLINESSSNFGQLNKNWNMFTLELVYGNINNDPIVNIRAYHKESGNIQLGGDFSGEVTVNIPKTSESPLNSIISAIKKIPGVSNIPGLSQVSDAVSFLGKFGNSSFFKSKTDMTVVKGTTAGKINLTGTNFQQFGGTVTNLTNIRLKETNNGEALGLWNISKNFHYIIDRYSLARPGYKGAYTAQMFITTHENLENLIVINPAVRSLIKKVYVKKVDFFLTENLDYFDITKLSDKIYKIRQSGPYSIFRKGISDFTPSSDPYDLILVLDHQIREDMYAAVTVQFEFNDGSIYESTRSYKIDASLNDNWEDIQNKTKIYKRVEYVY